MIAGDFVHFSFSSAGQRPSISSLRDCETFPLTGNDYKHKRVAEKRQGASAIAKLARKKRDAARVRPPF
jgi:hypothetical protein